MPFVPVLLYPPDLIAGTPSHSREAEGFFKQALDHKQKQLKEDEEILPVIIRVVVESI